MHLAELKKLENRIGYSFRNSKLLNMALTHKSYCYPNRGESNERLEYLGDSVLQLCVGEYLYFQYEEEDEGKLTRIRSHAVQRETLARCSRFLNLGPLLKLGHSEKNTGGSDKDSILEDAFEALIGAIYIDGGLEAARKLILQILEPIMLDKKSRMSDSKTQLQEIFQSHGTNVEYECLSTEGPPHNRKFTVCVKSESKVLGLGAGRSKKEAETKAAMTALEMIDERGFDSVSEKD